MATTTRGEETSVHQQFDSTAVVSADPFRSHMCGESEAETAWRHGAPPRYDQVNQLFRQGRTKLWPTGSLEETVQNLVKTWEMELSHKTSVNDVKTMDREKFTFSVNGGKMLTAEETLKVGSYNALLATILADEHAAYKASKETFDSSHEVFRGAFPGGFAWEVLEVYSGPPTVALKWRHWGYMQGAFKGHAPTGDIVESIGTCVAKVNKDLRIVELEVYYDPTQFLGQLTKLPKCQEYGEYKKGIEGCPFYS